MAVDECRADGFVAKIHDVAGFWLGLDLLNKRDGGVLNGNTRGHDLKIAAGVLEYHAFAK